jgi:hypothetical protein
LGRGSGHSSGESEGEGLMGLDGSTILHTVPSRKQEIIDMYRCGIHLIVV